MPESGGQGKARGRSRERAVALRYLPELPAPFLVANGDGRMAERLESLARESGVPILRDEGLADLLFPLELGAGIPVDLFEIVAKTFAFIWQAEES